MNMTIQSFDLRQKSTLARVRHTNQIKHEHHSGRSLDGSPYPVGLAECENVGNVARDRSNEDTQRQHGDNNPCRAGKEEPAPTQGSG